MMHKAVLVDELIKSLNLKPGDTVIDGTLGAGGHSIAALEKILPGGRLISIDWDERVIGNFENLLSKKGIAVSAKNPPPLSQSNFDDNKSPSGRCLGLCQEGKNVGKWWGINSNFANLGDIVKRLKIKALNAVFADLGFSSDQVEDPARGFSFLKNGPLDMRYSQNQQRMTAADVINDYSEERLADIFWKYGEEKYARKIARAIRLRRPALRRRLRQGEGFGGQAKSIRETKELVEIISKTIPKRYKHGRIHFATRTFQALRIEVNQELENLKKFLLAATDNLVQGGRLAVISFHSLEDRIVKNFFRAESRNCICPPKYPKCVCAHQARLKVVTPKPIVPSEQEIESNPRARSAKLRIAERVE